MRIVPVLTAILVSGIMYLFIMERDLLMVYAGMTPAVAQEPVAAETIESKPPVSVLVLRSKAQAVSRGIILRGETEAFRLVDVKSEATAHVISQPLRKGAFVEEGELLCQLDPGTREASLTEAKAWLAEAEANNNVATSLAQKGYGSENSVISRTASLEAAQARVKMAERQIEQLRIVAPFSGLLESDAAEIGTFMLPGSLCARVLALDPIKLVGHATEQQVSRLSVGGAAGAVLVGGQEVAGKLTFISRSADQQTRTYRVEVTVPNPLIDRKSVV